MRYDARQVLEIILDELGQVLGLPADAIEPCRQKLVELIRPRWRVLFLATGDRPPCEATVHAFRTLAALGVEATLIRSHSFAQTWTVPNTLARLGNVCLLDAPDPEHITQLPEQFPLLCILTLSGNTVAKTALGLHDAVPPRLLRAFLERARAVLAVGRPPQQVAVDQSDGLFWNLPLPMREWIARGYQTLEQWGVEFVVPEQLPRAVRRHLFGLPEAQAAKRPRDEDRGPSGKGRLFITVDDVRAARMRGERQIELPPNAVVTGEAREFAARWGILLVE